MKSKKAPLSVRIIYWLSTIFLGLLGLVLVAAVAFNILLYTDFFGDDMQLHTNLPVQVDFLEIGNAHINDQDVKVELVEAASKIHFFNTPSFIAKKVGLALIFVAFSACFGLGVFRKFIKNVRDGNTFTPSNIKLLKILAYSIFAFWIFMIIYDRLFYYYIGQSLDFENIRISSDFNNYSGVLFFALFIWALAHIFLTGLKLQDDNDLTI